MWCDWQVTLCDHLNALEVRFSRRCAIQIVYLYLYKFTIDIDTLSFVEDHSLSVCVSCYGMAVKQQPSVSALWHDLGVCYYHLMKVVEGHSVKVMANKCMESLKQALVLNPANHCHWNALGVAAAHPGSSLFYVIFIFSMLYSHIVLPSHDNSGLLNRFQGHCVACRKTLICAPVVIPKRCPTSLNPALLPS